MAEIYKGVFEDDKGNRYYAASDTEITYDTAGIPLNNGGDLSEASVNFTVSSSRKALTAKARFKALMGDIAKWLTDLGPAAFYKVADDFTTTAENYLFTARKGKQLKDEVDNLNQNLGGFEFSVSADGTPMYKPGGADSALPFKSAITYQKKLGYFSTTFTIPAGVKKCGLIWGGHTQTGTAVNISVTGAKISEHIPIWTALYFWTKLSILEVEEESIKCTVSGADRTSDCLMILLY